MSVVQEFLVTGFWNLTIVHLSSRAEHVKENGLTYPSPGIANGIKLSPQETRPSSPAALPSAGEKVKDLLLLSAAPGATKGRLEKAAMAWKMQEYCNLWPAWHWK